MSLDSNLRGVHPVLAHRVRLLLAEPKLSKYGTYPAVRDRAKQERLYAAYKAGRGNLAANPNRTLRTGAGFPYDWTPKGSWHMVQGDRDHVHHERDAGDDRGVAERVAAGWQRGEDVRGPGKGPGQDEDLPDVSHRRFFRVGPDGPEEADGPAVGADGGVGRGMASAAVDAAVTAMTVRRSPLSIVEFVAT